jgi:hypothetical protein
MPDPCGVTAGNFEDMSSANKYAYLAAVLRPGESSGRTCEYELRESGVGEPEPADVGHIETPMQSQVSGENGTPPFENDTAATKRGHPDSHMYRENDLRVRCVGEPVMAAEGVAAESDTQMPSQLSDGTETQSSEAAAAESDTPAPEIQQSEVQRDTSGDVGDGGMDAKDAEEASRFDVVMSGDETLQLPAVEFDSEVQERVGRWSADLPSGSITLYLPMPTHLAQHSMVEAAKVALGRQGQMLDAQVKAGSRVVVRASQQDLREWLGKRNWFKLPGDETLRGIWCSKQNGAQREVIVSDRPFTVILENLKTKDDSLTMEDAHRMLEKRDNMIASTQNELASVNLKFAEARSRLHSVKRGFTERMLVNRKAAEVMQNELDEVMKTNAELAYRISWMKQELVDTINNLDIRLANQNDRHTAVITEMKRLTTETDQTTNYQLNHLITENGILKEKNDNLQWEYDSLEKSCDGWEGQIKRVESQRDSARLELSTLRAKLEAGGVEDQVKEMTTQRDSAHTDLKSLRPETTDRRPPKRKERDDENGADTLNPSMHSLTYTNMCYRLGPSRTGTGSYGSLGSCTSTGSHRPFPLLLAQLGDLYEHQLRLKRTPLARGTSIKSKHLLAETGIKGEHLFAETEIKGEHLFAETESKGEHLFAETEIKGEHLFAETGIKGEHLFAETGIKGEHLFAEIKNKGEHLLAETKNVNWKQEGEPVKNKRAGW